MTAGPAARTDLGMLASVPDGHSVRAKQRGFNGRMSGRESVPKISTGIVVRVVPDVTLLRVSPLRATIPGSPGRGTACLTIPGRCENEGAPGYRASGYSSFGLERR